MTAFKEKKFEQFAKAIEDDTSRKLEVRSEYDKYHCGTAKFLADGQTLFDISFSPVHAGEYSDGYYYNVETQRNGDKELVLTPAFNAGRLIDLINWNDSYSRRKDKTLATPRKNFVLTQGLDTLSPEEFKSPENASKIEARLTEFFHGVLDVENLVNLLKKCDYDLNWLINIDGEYSKKKLEL